MTTYSPRSPIRSTAPVRIDTQALAAYVVRLGAERVSETRAYIDAVVSGALQLQLDPIVLLAQWWLETDAGRSMWWKSRLNPAGLGITGDADQNAASQTWTTGTDSAMAHLAHMCAYVYGSGTFARWPATWPDVLLIDKRFPAPIAAGYSASVLDDLTNTWAVDNRYGQKLADRASAILRDFADEVTPAVEPEGDDGMAVTFGRVPMPAYERRIVENSRAWNDLGVRTIRGVVWHRMYGTLWGTDGYFRGAAAGTALTDFGVGVAATDGADNDGRAFMWCDPAGRRSPWANGPVTNPRDDGRAFVDRYGVNGSQRDLVSIEISGNGNTALSAKARAWIVAATAYYADQYKVSHETFPLIPSEGNRSFVIWHGEINGGKWGACPGTVVEGQTNAMIAEVKARLKQYQEGAAAEYATPSPVAAGTQIINDRLFVGVDKEYTIQRPVAPRLWADPSSPLTGPVLDKGVKVRVSHMVEDVGPESGLTLVLADGSRIAAIALVAA